MSIIWQSRKRGFGIITTRFTAEKYLPIQENQLVRIAFIIVTTSQHEKDSERLRKQILAANIPNTGVYVVRNKIGTEGYAYGVNRGLRAALADKSEYLFVVNPDVDLSDFLKSSFLAVGKQFDIYGYAMDQDDTTYYGGTIDPYRLSAGLTTDKPDTRFAACDFVSGALVGFRRRVLKKVGMWDERYYMYYEDVDFCKRATALGLTVGIDRDIHYTHYETSKKLSKEKTGYDKGMQLQSSHVRFFLEYAAPKNIVYELVRYPLTRRSEPEFARILQSVIVRYFKRVCRLA